MISPRKWEKKRQQRTGSLLNAGEDTRSKILIGIRRRAMHLVLAEVSILGKAETRQADTAVGNGPCPWSAIPSIASHLSGASMGPHPPLWRQRRPSLPHSAVPARLSRGGEGSAGASTKPPMQGRSFRTHNAIRKSPTNIGNGPLFSGGKRRSNRGAGSCGDAICLRFDGLAGAFGALARRCARRRGLGAHRAWLLWGMCAISSSGIVNQRRQKP